MRAAIDAKTQSDGRKMELHMLYKRLNGQEKRVIEELGRDKASSCTA